MLEDSDDRFVQEIPAAPRELREDFPGKFHLHLLWGAIRANENTIRQRLPCRLSYRQLGVLLAREMGKDDPYSVITIGNYMLLLRNKGWVKTFQIVYPNIRQNVRKGVHFRSHSKKSQISYPTHQFVNYARTASDGNALVICCVFVKDGIKFTKKRKGVRFRSHSDRVGCMLFTNINNSIEELCSFCEATKKEIKGLFNMKGFHTYFEKTDTPTESRLADAKLLHSLLIDHNIGVGQRTSLSKWAYQLEKAHNRYPDDCQQVFDWLIASLPLHNWLRQAVQCPNTFYKKFQRIKEWSQRDATKKSKYTPNENVDLLASYLRSTHPKICSRIDEVGEKELEMGLLHMVEFALDMDVPLTQVVANYSRNSDMWNIAYELRKAVVDDDGKFVEGVERLLKGHNEWKEWKGHLRKKLIWGLTEDNHLNAAARDWFIFLMKKKGERSSERQNKIMAAINRELNNGQSD